MSGKNKLITLLPSTGVDLGRWLLQHYGVAYTEYPHAPIFHILALKWYGRGPNDYPLFIQGSHKLGGIDELFPYLNAQAPADLSLVPDPDKEPELHKEVMELQHYARIYIGDAVVGWSYYHLLKYKATVWPSLVTDVPWIEKILTFIGFPLIRILMYKGLKLDAKTSEDYYKRIYEGFDRIDALLSDGRQFLLGDRFTLADIAVSATFAPVILGQGYQGMLPNQATCPDYLQKIYKDLRNRPTGQFIQRMFDTQRPERCDFL